MSNKRAFKLNSTDVDFQQRQKDVFDQLNVLETNRKNSGQVNEEMDTDEPEVNNRKRQRSATKHFRGKESIFKKPQNPIPRNYINKIPDFKKNPHKWKKYSLEDVEDITEESNTKSALSFLKELANRKKRESGFHEDEKLEELPTKIVFKKHTSKSLKPRDEETVNEDKASFQNCKLVMPEYVIGQTKIKKDKKNMTKKAEKGKELKLDHLFENE